MTAERRAYSPASLPLAGTAHAPAETAASVAITHRTVAKSQVVMVGVSCMYDPNTDEVSKRPKSKVELLTPDHCDPPLQGEQLKARRALGGPALAAATLCLLYRLIRRAFTHPPIPIFALSAPPTLPVHPQRMALYMACENAPAENITRYGALFTDTPNAAKITKVRFQGGGCCWE